MDVEGSGAYFRPWGVNRPFRVSRDYAGLHPCPTFVRVNLKEGVHVLGEVENYGVVDGLTGQAGSASPRQYGDAASTSHVNGREHVVPAPGDDDAHGFHLVDAGVGAVEHLGEGIEAHFAFDQLAQLLLQGLGLGRGTFHIGVTFSFTETAFIVNETDRDRAFLIPGYFRLEGRGGATTQVRVVSF